MQLLRYGGYDKEKRRSTVHVIGSFDYYLTSMQAVPTDLLEKLTTAEREQLAAWLKEKADQHAARDAAISLRALPTTLEKCKVALAAGEPVVDPDALFKAMRDLQQALAKAGYKRGKPGTKAASSTAASGTNASPA